MSQVTNLLPLSGPGSGTVTSVNGGTGIAITGIPTVNPTVNLTVPVVIANGGTNAIAMANTYGVNYFDGTSLVTTTVGTAGQLLTSNGAGVAPTFQAAPVSGTVTSVNGGTGIAITGIPTVNPTVSLTVPVVIANGGTNATAYTQTNGIVTYNGTRLVNYAGPQLSSAGVYTNATQPAFHAYASTAQLAATGDGTIVKVAYNTVVFDNTGSFIPASNLFFTPVTGKYMFGFSIYLNGIVAVNNSLTMTLVTDSGSYSVFCNPYAIQASGIGPLIQYYSGFINLNAGDNVYVNVQVYNTTKGVNLQPGATYSYFWGYLVC